MAVLLQSLFNTHGWSQQGCVALTDSAFSSVGISARTTLPQQHHLSCIHRSGFFHLARVQAWPPMEKRYFLSTSHPKNNTAQLLPQPHLLTPTPFGIQYHLSTTPTQSTTTMFDGPPWFLLITISYSFITTVPFFAIGVPTAQKQIIKWLPFIEKDGCLWLLSWPMTVLALYLWPVYLTVLLLSTKWETIMNYCFAEGQTCMGFDLSGYLKRKKRDPYDEEEQRNHLLDDGAGTVPDDDAETLYGFNGEDSQAVCDLEFTHSSPYSPSSST